MSKKTTIGGQAILEGIVMKGPRKSCTVVRKSDGELVISQKEYTPLSEKYKFCGWPIIRGAINLFLSLKDGMEAIEYSSQFIDEDEQEKPSRFELWLEKHLSSEKLEKVIMTIALFFGIGIPVVLFFLLPTFLGGLLPDTISVFSHNLIEGALRIVIFLTFMWAVSHMQDIKRTFCYHGAEHKTIFCYEAMQELTVENVRKQEKYHPRCGTSFLLVLVIVSTLLSSVIFTFIQTDSALLRMGIHLLILPLIVGITYEINRFAGRVDNAFTHILRWPGLQLQHLTVFEPDDSMIEVAIEAMRRVIPEDDSDQW